ncbi:PAS domain S-box protein [Halolamina rubra]|uniref:PAS domain S-box protein n=1 Tax=Halolamina rubra TaxID=1380430 RepID=UPI00067895A9|nr:PAS domain S-box protein [Halolamina rubra]
MQTPPETVRVLHVDPDSSFVAAAAERLEREDDRLDVTTATDADEALALLASEAYDGVIAEYDLPGRTGLELFRSVREREPALPFLLFTGAGSEAVASDALSAGVTDYRRKGRADDQYAALAERVVDAVERRGLGDEPAGSSERAGSAPWNLTPAEYRDVFARAEVGIGIMDPETGTFEEVNQRWAELLGYDIEELCGKSVDEISADDPRFDQAAAMERIREVVDGSPQQFDWLHERADGTSVWCEVNLKRTRIGDEPRLLAFIREVDDRKERRRNLQFLEALLESVGVGVGAYGADGRLAYVNETLAETLGTETDRLMGEPIWELTENFDREEFPDYWDSFEEGETRTEETVYRFGDRTIPVETVTTCAEIQGTTYHFGTVTDVTDRKEQEERFQAFVEHSNDILSVLDGNGIYQYQSPSAERILGYSPGELVGDVAFEYIHPEDRADVLTAFEQVIANPGEDLVVEYRFRHGDGSWRWLESRGVNPSETAAIDGFLINSRDVTDRKEHERQIGELHDATREMVQATDEQDVCSVAVDTAEEVLSHPIAGIWLRDEAGHSLEPAAVTTTVEEMYDELPVYTDGDSLSWRAYRTGEALVADDLSTESGLYNPDSRVRSVIVVPIGEYGVLNVGSHEVDAFTENEVTLAKLLAANAQVALGRSERERQLERQTDRMEFFNSILRHDVLNAITVIRARAEFLADELDGEQLQDAETIVRWSDDVTEIVQRVRTVVETLAGEGDPELEPVDLAAALRGELDRVRSTYPAVVFETDVPDSQPVLANDLLGDVLGNLVTNAIEHNDVEGLRLSVTVERDDDDVVVRVADNGSGVADERKEAIFRRGETGHAKSTGSGFGLFFADAMVEEYGGEIRLEDNDAGGATFVVRLTAVDHEAAL